MLRLSSCSGLIMAEEDGDTNAIGSQVQVKIIFTNPLKILIEII